MARFAKMILHDRRNTSSDLAALLRGIRLMGWKIGTGASAAL